MATQPRGFKRDFTETAARNFDDPRSFVALNSGCEMLYGKDKERRRYEMYKRSGGMCESDAHAPNCRRFVNWVEGEWHHTEVHDGKRCDCLGGGLFVTQACHRFAHRKRNPRWTLNKEAEKEFNRLNA